MVLTILESALQAAKEGRRLQSSPALPCATVSLGEAITDLKGDQIRLNNLSEWGVGVGTPATILTHSLLTHSEVKALENGFFRVSHSITRYLSFGLGESLKGRFRKLVYGRRRGPWKEGLTSSTQLGRFLA